MPVNHRMRVAAVLQVLRGEPVESVALRTGTTGDELAEWVDVFRDGGGNALRDRFPAPSRRRYAPPAASITTVGEALAYAATTPSGTYGRFLSDALAVVVANGMRSRGFEGILPDRRGGFESRSRSSRGFKKLDVNYSTVEMGLGLGVSIKTISKRDPGTGRYTKNYSRNDNELRAEAMDYHQRQPYAVLVGMLFLPIDSADDAGSGTGEEAGISSFGAAVRYFRNRCPRELPTMPADLFEGFFVAAYDLKGTALFYDVTRPNPPRDRRPTSDEVLTLDCTLDRTRDIYDERNNRQFTWAER